MTTSDENGKKAKLQALEYNNSGHGKYMRVDFDDAIEDYTKAIHLDPCLAVAYYNRGTVLYRLGNYELALKDFAKSVELDPENVNFAEGLSECKKMFSMEGGKGARKVIDEDIKDLVRVREVYLPITSNLSLPEFWAILTPDEGTSWALILSFAPQDSTIRDLMICEEKLAFICRNLKEKHRKKDAE